jgi:hypothetical protein
MPRRAKTSPISASPVSTSSKCWSFRSGGRAIRQAVSHAVAAATGYVSATVELIFAAPDFTAVGYGMEYLEPRRMLTTLQATPASGPQVFQYLDAAMETIDIEYNDVTFEAIGTLVDPTTGNATLSDLVQPANPAPALGSDLYKIYVTQSNASSYIAISNTNADGNLIDLSGNIGSLAVTGTQGQAYTTGEAAGTGDVFIGAADPVSVPGPTPITQVQLLTSFGLQPAPDSGFLTPGIEVIPTDPNTGLQNDFGNFLVGGTVTGTVSFGGNVNEFYAGSVLTGNIDGSTPASQTSAIDTTPNFTVAGDLREFVTDGPVGTDGALYASGTDINQPEFTTGFYMTVGGTLGEMHVGNSGIATNPNFAGTVQVQNSKYVSGLLPYPTGTTDPVVGMRSDQTEVEVLPTDGFPGDAFASGNVDLSNDGLDNPQILGSIPVLNATSGDPETDADGNIIYQASVDGNLQGTEGDASDTYGIPLMAGQTITVAVDTTAVAYDVFDPDGRMIASSAEAGALAQQITTDRPGVYLVEILPVAGGDNAYNLTVTNTGNLAIGGIWIQGDYDDVGLDSGILASYGSIGLVNAVGVYLSTTTGPTPSTDPSVPLNAPSSISVPAGDLRVVEAGQLGERSTTDPLNLIDGPYLNVPFGNVGLIDTYTTAATSDALSVGVLNFNSQFDPNYLDEGVFKTDDAEATAIGGYIQVIHAASSLEADVATNQGIGTIYGADLDTDTASYFDVNADNTGDDGIIDLVDVPGQFGTVAAGGPSFVTNDGGDIRYMNLNTTSGAIFRDEAFGGTADDPITYQPGQAATITDAAGNTITATPLGDVVTTQNTIETNTAPIADATDTGTTVTTTTTTTAGPQITILSYPVIDKAGAVPIEILSTGGLQISGSGTSGSDTAICIANVEFGTAGGGIGDEASNVDDIYGNTLITQIPSASTDISTTTSNVTTNTTTTTVVTATTTSVVTGSQTNSLSLLLSGTASVNVLNVDSLGDASSIINTTAGEVASIEAPEIGQLTIHGNLGYTKPVASPAAVMPAAVITGGNTFPFDDQRTGVVVTGDIVAVQVYGALGNIEASGTIGSIIANYAVSTGVKGAYPIAGQIDGIVGPVVANVILGVDIGQELAFSGTGSVGFAGLYTTGKIGSVENFGNPGANIYGTIVTNDTNPDNGVGIDSVSLVNGSIVDATIGTISGAFNQTDDLVGVFVSPSGNQLLSANPFVYDIGSVVVSGTGGIIGSTIQAFNIGPVTVKNGGFGILDTQITSENLGTIANVTASGYGIRGSGINDGTDVGRVTATGNGSLVSVLTYPVSVRPSDSTTPDYDPATGQPVSKVNDLNSFLGTSLASPNIANVTDTGVLEDDVINGLANFAGFTAYRVRTASPILPGDEGGTPLPEPTIPDVPAIGTVYSMSATFGGTIGNCVVYNTVDGLQITAGRLVGFTPHNNVSRLGISVAGTINALTIHGNLGTLYQNPVNSVYVPDSYIDAGGPSGTIGRLEILGSLFANVSATGKINTLIVAGDVDGSITADAQTTGLAVGTLHISGGLRDGSLKINGSAGSVIINGGLGSPTGSLDINGNVNLISVGADHSRTGSLLQLALTVGGTLKNLTVHGAITGSVDVAGDLDALNVTGDGTTGNVISGDVTVGGSIHSARVVNGSVSGKVTASGDINSFVITRGNLAAGGVVESQIASVKSFTINGGTGYGLFGSVLAPSGLNQSLNVSGNFGDGTDAAVYNASSGTLFKVAGSIEPAASVNYVFYLNKLQVAGSIATGATITANPIKVRVIGGTTAGTVNG